MSKIKKALLFLVLSITTFTAQAQTENFGTWTSVEINKKLEKWEIGAETELRTIYGLQLIDRWSLGLNSSYKLSKHLQLSAGYDLKNTLDTKYKNYQLRNRFNLAATGKLKLNDFTFSLRERIQLTTKDESNRIKSDGTIDTYSINPALVWRNKLLISYNIPKCKLTPSVSAETFYSLNNPVGNSFDKLRYTLNLNYKLNKVNSINLFGVLNNNLENSEEYGKYIIGVSYKISL